MTIAEPATALADKRVSWAELFFDLVYVFAVTEVSDLVERDPTWAGALRALIVFVPLYWTWVGTTIQANQHDVSTPLMRMAVFAIALGGMFMALAVPEAYASRALLFACAYWAARLVLGLVLYRRTLRAINPVTLSMAVTGPLLVAGALVHGSASEAVWGAAALIDLGMPTILRHRLAGMHFDAPHLAERFGLFLLIAIGESVVAIGASAQSGGGLSVAVGVSIAIAFVISCGLWWVYFNFAADAVRHALATAQVQIDVTRRVLSYGHLSFIAAIILCSVGLREALVHPGEALEAHAVGLLFGGSALYLATFGYTRWTMFHLVSRTRLTAAAAVLVLIVPALHVPAMAALAFLAAVLVVLNTVEYAQVERTGWRAVLGRRASGAHRPRSGSGADQRSTGGGEGN
jgi:low temperature requirement protein LtrA